MTSLGTKENLPALFGMIAAVAIPSILLLRRRRTVDTYEPPVAPASIFQCVREIGAESAQLFVQDMAEATGSYIYRLRLPLPGGVFIVGDPFVQREILQAADSEKPFLYETFAKIGGPLNVFTRKTADPLWKSARKGSAPAFSSREVNRMNSVCRDHLQKWIDTTVRQGLEFDPSEEMIRLTFSIVMESAFEYAATDDEFASFTKDTELALREFTFRQSTNPFRQVFGFLIPEARRAFQACLRCREFAQKVLDTYRSNPEKSQQNTLIKLIDENPAFAGDDKQKVSELITYMIAGFDTTGYTLATTLILLAQHPELVKKARAASNGDGKMTEEVQNILNESNRLYPVAAIGSMRFLPRDLTVFDQVSQRKFVIPKGSTCILPQYLPNRSKIVYGDDADQFRPDRWESATPEMRDSRIMFALGNRNCIGQSLATAELQTVLPRIIQDYDIELVEPGHLDYFLTLKFHGSRIKLKKIATS